MKKISLLTPTRERVPGCRQLIQSVFDTVTHPDRIEMLFYIDNDDKNISQYQDMFAALPTEKFADFHATYGDPMPPSHSWNVIAKKCKGDILFMCNDDQVFLAKGWDDRLEQEMDKYPDGIYCMFFNEGLWHGKKCTFIMVGRQWYETLGYFTPPVFEGVYSDAWVEDVAKRVGRLIYIPDFDGLTMIHNHWTRQPGRVQDETTKRIRINGIPGRDNKMFAGSAQRREADAHKLKRLIKG